MNEDILSKMSNVNESIKAQIKCSTIELGETNILTKELEGSNNEWLQSYIEGKVDEMTAEQMRRIIAKAVIKSVNEKTMEVPAEAESIASLVDEGMTRMKVAYQVESGEYDIADAFEEIINHQVARVATIADYAIAKAEQIALEHSDKVTDTVIDIAAEGLKSVVSAFPPTRPLTHFIETGAQMIKPYAREIVKIGIQSLANSARSFVKQAEPLVRRAVDYVGRKLKRWASRLIS